MKKRSFGRTGQQVGEVGFGAWAIGGSWGNVSEHDAEAALHAALDAGVTFIDTADVYGGGRSERLIARVLKQRHQDDVIVATKAGRQLNPHVAGAYTADALTRFVEGSLERLQTDALDLVQLHCPPTDVYYRPEVFEALDRLVQAGKIRHYGVSVEKVEEAIKALEYPIASVQIIYNLFRQRPAELFFRLAQERQVAVIARVPLASGLLTGKLSDSSQFAADDHRAFNRHGEAFDVGETFSGVPFEVGLKAVEELRSVAGTLPMAQFALRWILMSEAVTVVIPGARNPDQAVSNARAAELPALTADQMDAARSIYDRLIRPHVHQRW
ncbi:aldo/keto reductase [Microvirga terrae]|uniref:Aldo/keto reductase n=1 Tax=Microvirga terrae TaxID=2740529 RepID=A0ABY5RP58_9HYPH|nr:MULTISPECIES: aldo/keto reductase [Microvirga]MBQ0821724.1 aldo/keto reductase [Microvirga sp. HBU67558]UVF17799.1 aldo/keto reductase [Microvirga terrae]